MPLENNMKFEKKEGNQFPLLPKGIYQAELLDVKAVENETYDSKMGQTASKEYQTDLAWQFTLLAGRDEKQENEKLKELRGRNIWDSFGQNYLYIGKNGKNGLYRICEAFLGRELTREEEAVGVTSEMLNSFINKQINLSIETKVSKKGKEFDNIIDYFKVNAEIVSLTKEEIEKATVKDKEEDTMPSSNPNRETPPVQTEEINPDSILF